MSSTALGRVTVWLHCWLISVQCLWIRYLVLVTCCHCLFIVAVIVGSCEVAVALHHLLYGEFT